ncbi:aromatic-ring hydroxylase C-terminal domain-containing protein [Amycolatopsis sp. NPDC003861]
MRLPWSGRWRAAVAGGPWQRAAGSGAAGGSERQPQRGAPLGAPAVLLRPDGYVAGTSRDAAHLTRALTAWFGPRVTRSGGP